ncbi:hypothetical protein F0562_034928 [Nyssa sinensis]|uniref:Uncharacterized protein n=1 Tax=Nyssa sinensis TaxID=561372 RepID=A0A5J5ACZ9_9ASTE|nr:hypothetical protein F0562_034928 [Nyssa sinensis]
MKTLLALLVIFVLILGTPQTNAERVSLEDRRLLSDANLGRKVNGGVNDKDLTAVNKVAEATENGNTCTEVDNNNDETNQSYGNYGEDGSSTDSHHYFHDKDLTAGNKVAEATENGNTCTEVDNNNDETNQSYERISLEDRQPLSNANLGRKVNVGGNHKDLTAGNKGAEDTKNQRLNLEGRQLLSEANLGRKVLGVTDAKDLGDLEGSTIDTHHYFTTDKPNP